MPDCLVFTMEKNVYPVWQKSANPDTEQLMCSADHTCKQHSSTSTLPVHVEFNIRWEKK